MVLFQRQTAQAKGKYLKKQINFKVLGLLFLVTLFSKSLFGEELNSKIIKLAKSNVIFCHCLPASVGEEVTSKVLYGPNSIVFKQALNRIYIQMAIINWCLK